MKTYPINPVLPNFEYTPDVEPRIFNDRLYLYGSHDQYLGKDFCVNDYVTWSAPVSDLNEWRFEGIIYKKTLDPANKDGKHNLYAPDVVQGLDGQYYLYYCLEPLSQIGVAVSDKPQGPFSYLDYVRYADGTILGQKEFDMMQFDPAVLVDGESVYLYTGQGITKRSNTTPHPKRKGVFCYRLDNDMTTILSSSGKILPIVGEVEGTTFLGKEFFEASSIRKYNGIYYFTYASSNLHELCYAFSNYPDKEFTFGGTLISNGDIGYKNNKVPLNYIGNIHGGMLQLNNEFFIFYHRQTNRSFYSRQACAERIKMSNQGQFEQVEMTTQGLYAKPLPPEGKYLAAEACNIMSVNGGAFSHPMVQNDEHPAYVQSKEDNDEVETQYVENLRDGAIIGFKYFDLSESKISEIMIEVKSTADGKVIMSNDLNSDSNNTIIPINKSNDWVTYSVKCNLPKGIYPLYFIYHGDGKLDFYSFTFK